MPVIVTVAAAVALNIPNDSSNRVVNTDVLRSDIAASVAAEREACAARIAELEAALCEFRDMIDEAECFPTVTAEIANKIDDLFRSAAIRARGTE